MTTAEFWFDENVIVMDVKGHAGFEQVGKDPVCAGASVLAMTVAQCVEDMYAAGKLRKKPNIRVENGRVMAVAKPKRRFFHEALHVFWVGEVGMQLLSETYPAHVTLKAFDTASGDVEGKTQESDAESINQKDSPT